MKREDMTGVKVGMLTITCIGPSARGYSRWVCRCDCGTEVIRTKPWLDKAIENELNASCDRCMRKPATNYDMRRSRRKRAQRALSIFHPATVTAAKKLELLDNPATHWRPKTRGDCVRVPRPCPYVGCANNLFLDASLSGSIKLNFPDLEPHEMGDSCALDIADRGGSRLDTIGDAMNLTRERVRQIEISALRKLGRSREAIALDESEESAA